MSADNQMNYRWAKVTRVNDHLYIGGAIGLTVAVIQHHNITCIINATVEAPSIFLSGVVVQKLWIKDVPETDLGSHLFDEVADLINIQHGEGGRTLVHCVHGVSRSAALVLAYLLKYQEMRLREAYNLLAHLRPMVRPNSGFWRQLMDYEKTIYGRNSVHFIDDSRHGGASHRNAIPDVYLMSTGILEETEEEEEEDNADDETTGGDAANIQQKCGDDITPSILQQPHQEIVAETRFLGFANADDEHVNWSICQPLDDNGKAQEAFALPDDGASKARIWNCQSMSKQNANICVTGSVTDDAADPFPSVLVAILSNVSNGSQNDENTSPPISSEKSSIEAI